MSNMFQFLAMMAIPVVFFLTCRYLNLRGDRIPVPPDPALDATAVADSAGRTGHGGPHSVSPTRRP
jgi:hypothetical protein